jgi:hypothetical protein
MTTSKSDPRPAALDDAEALIRRVTEYEAKATEAPWCLGRAGDSFHAVAGGEIQPRISLKAQCHGKDCYNLYHDPDGGDVTAPCAGISKEDGTFMALARTDLPRAIALLRVLVERVRELEKAVKQLVDYRRRVGPLGWQLEKADMYMRDLAGIVKQLKEKS